MMTSSRRKTVSVIVMMNNTVMVIPEHCNCEHDDEFLAEDCGYDREGDLPQVRGEDIMTVSSPLASVSSARGRSNKRKPQRLRSTGRAGPRSFVSLATLAHCLIMIIILIVLVIIVSVNIVTNFLTSSPFSQSEGKTGRNASLSSLFDDMENR